MFRKVTNSHKFNLVLDVSCKIIYFVQDTLFIFLLSFLNLILLNKLYRKKLVLVSGASEEYFLYLNNLLSNIWNYSFFEKVIIYDLGLSEIQKTYFQSLNNIEFRQFNYSKYPSFLNNKNIAGENKIGAYAWKAAIIKEVCYEQKNQVIWMDSANIINSKFVFTKIALSFLGNFSALSSGNIKKWTYHTLISDLNLEKKILKKKNLNGAVVAFDFNNTYSMKILNKWYELCMQERYISPPGSNRRNHRQDQTLLSIVFHQNKKNYLPKILNNYGIKIHQWPDRIYYFSESKDSFFSDFRKAWYKEYGNVSVNSIDSAEIVIFTSFETFKDININKFKNKNIYLILDDIAIKEANWEKYIKYNISILTKVNYINNFIENKNLKIKYFTSLSPSEIFELINLSD